MSIIDCGVLLISFSKGKEMDIKFYGMGDITKNTKISILHHTLYNDDYILSNIKIDGKEFVTVEELFQISPIHEKWIKVKETPDGEGIEGERKEFHRERKEYHYDKAKYHEEKENQ